MAQYIKRYGSVIELVPGRENEYIKLHSDVWPEVLKTITECNIRNYSIYVKDHLLFSYFEYAGKDYDSDMKKMAADPITVKWWATVKPCMKPVSSGKEGEWWAEMEEIFHHD